MLHRRNFDFLNVHHKPRRNFSTSCRFGRNTTLPTSITRVQAEHSRVRIRNR